MASCAEDSKEISFKTVKTTEKDYGCESDCADVSINKTEVVGHDSKSEGIADKINQVINESFVHLLTIDEDNVQNVNTIDEGVKRFISIYQEDKNSYPDMAAKYETSIESEVFHQSENLLSIKILTYNYMGGAHGYSAISYLNFDPKTGEFIGIDQMINDMDNFTSFVENKFREEYDLPEGTDLSEKFWFDDDVFILPEDMGFDKNNMVFTYNPYDIAPYAEGTIELKIPIKEVQPFLNRELK